MTLLRLLAAVTVLTACAGCGTARVPLSYPSKNGTMQLSSPVKAGQFVDARGEPQHYLGTVRGGFGNPLFTVESELPVATVFETAVGEALRVRGAAVQGPGAAVVNGRITRLDCNQVARREAHVEFEVEVTSEGARVFSRAYKTTRLDGSLMGPGFAGPATWTRDMRETLAAAIEEAVDTALDDPDFRKAIGASRHP